MRFWGGALLLLVTVAPLSAFAAEPAFLCGPARVRKAGSGAVDVALTDRFATRKVTLATPETVCWAEAPANVTVEGYDVRSKPRKARRVGADIVLVTRFGREALAVKSLGGMLVPVSDDHTDPALPPRVCYAVRGGRPDSGKSRVAFTDASGERLYDVGRATRLCVPTADDTAPALVCHAARLARSKLLKQTAARPGAMTLTSHFGTDVLRVGAPRELCVPALAETPPVDPGFTLAIAPSALDVIAGRRSLVTATAHFDDGHDESYSGVVAWSSSDENVARIVSSSAGGAFVGAVGPGTATISATHLATGVSSADSGGNATIVVRWPLEKLTIEPHAVTKRTGDHEGYTVTGHFTGGFTQNVTQRMIYASSNTAVAVASNTPGNRSRVEAIARGTSIISARDPISGITTTDSANDATLRVAGNLSYITITSNLTFPVLPPGDSQRFTARGVFDDGSELNLTQQCAWASSDPSVALAPNTPGDRSRIDTVAAGVTFISCFDPPTGKVSAPTQLRVLGPLSSIVAGVDLQPSEYPRTGQTFGLFAIGRYVGGGERFVSKDVVWATRDPDLVSCPNEPPRVNRCIALSGGQARVYATDPKTGIVSNDAIVPVLGHLIDLIVRAPYPYYQFDAIPVGLNASFEVQGIFEGGTLNLSYHPEDFVLESSDPSIATITPEGRVHGVAPGSFQLTARDVETGITSAAITVQVVGGLESITLTPQTATRGIGEWESFTAIGHYPPGFTDNLTQFLEYSSSDTAVAVADNAFRMRSRVRTVGAGTATITAKDPYTGVSGTATITVLPGTIDRVTIEPASVVRNVGNSFPFTAIGHYPDGTTINVTQVVEWDTLVPDVAFATNEAGNRSRIVAMQPGTSGITARHPSGVSSHDTNDDATMVVKVLAHLSLTPAMHKGRAGTVQRYTLVGIFDDTTEINLTQDAYYWTDNTTIARAGNVEGDRSAVELVAPGTTNLHATFADWSAGYPVIAGSVVGAFISVVP